MAEKFIIKDDTNLYVTRTDIGIAFGLKRKDAIRFTEQEADELINEIQTIKLIKEVA